MSNYDIFAIAASAASIISFVYILYADILHSNYKNAVFTTVLFVSVGLSGFLAFQGYKSRLLSNQLANLNPPIRCDFDFYSNGEQCGFVIAVMSILERHHDEIPQAISLAASRQAQACGNIRGSIGYDKFLEDRRFTEHAAEAMCQVVNHLKSR